ncbi:MAG: FliM/FliN family flagellar motor switch protein [Alphaproteobacteria bacterium]|nr:FliM/FliN family flagellar motor switch protein [Alphaproteobacteria bacterium]
MTLVTGSGVLHRMTRHPEAETPDVPLTASRAVRLAVARAAQTHLALKLTVGSVAEQALSLDALLADMDDDLLLMGLTRDGAVCGIMACDAGLVSATIEMMTTGRVTVNPPDGPRVTRTEGTLVLPLLRHILDEMEETTIRTVLDGWARTLGLGARFENTRAAGFALTEQTYRLLRLSLDCGLPERQGTLLLALPVQTAAPPQTTAAAPAPTQDWQDQFRAAVLSAPARLDAVLHRMKVPLSTLTGMEVGMCLPLNGCTVGMVRLVDPNGNTVARGRLGQIAGQIAVRIQDEADTIPMTDMDGAPEAGRHLRTRASDEAAMQFDADAVEDVDWSADPLSL